MSYALRSRLPPLEVSPTLQGIQSDLLDGIRENINKLELRMDVVERWQKKRTHINPQQYKDAAVVVGIVPPVPSAPRKLSTSSTLASS